MEITIDTHCLVWYLDEALNSKLSQKALDNIIEAERTGIIYLPIVVLMEVLHLSEKGRVNLSFSKMLSLIKKSNNFKIIPFDIEILRIAETVKSLEAHDRLIVATALFNKTPIVSKDHEIIKHKSVKVIW